MKITTCNVNGTNGRLPVLWRWPAEAGPHVVCVQESKSLQDNFPRVAIEAVCDGAIWQGQQSWNGVVILARGRGPRVTPRGLPGAADDCYSRFPEAAVECLHPGRGVADSSFSPQPRDGGSYGEGRRGTSCPRLEMSSDQAPAWVTLKAVEKSPRRRNSDYTHGPAAHLGT